MLGFVPLRRRFIAWTDRETGDPEVISYLLGSGEALTWKDLLSKHRVVVLAEAGSGKSTELHEQARLSVAAGRYTFSATVQAVGGRGLASAIGMAASTLEEWQKSDQPAWFFFDSVDEAKENNVRLDDAMRAIADGIKGGESRAHIVLSGRHTDWEFRRDLEDLETQLGMPPADLVATTMNPNELVISTVRQDTKIDLPPAEAPLIVVMAGLDREQVKGFASGKGIADVPAFCRAMDKSNLWSLARRPHDLDWLVQYWGKRKEFGPLAVMLELGLKGRLVESDPRRGRNDPIDATRAMEALERIGAGLVLQRVRDIAIPEASLDLSDRRSGLDLAAILPDWTGQHRARLITRGVFTPASAGLTRLHNDNEGVVRGFLAARWLKRLITANCPNAAVTDILFATIYDEHLVIPSMRQTAAWLSLWSSATAQEVISCDPQLLMDAGDPASLPLSVRKQALRAVVERIKQDTELRRPNRDSLQRFAMPDMVPCVRSIWNEHGDAPAVRQLLLFMI